MVIKLIIDVGYQKPIWKKKKYSNITFLLLKIYTPGRILAELKSLIYNFRIWRQSQLQAPKRPNDCYGLFRVKKK